VKPKRQGAITGATLFNGSQKVTRGIGQPLRPPFM
jgi:hypothetical protein